MIDSQGPYNPVILDMNNLNIRNVTFMYNKNELTSFLNYPDRPTQDQINNYGKLILDDPDRFYSIVELDLSSIKIKEFSFLKNRDELITFLDTSQTQYPVVKGKYIWNNETDMYNKVTIDLHKIMVQKLEINLTKQYIENNKNNQNKIIINDPIPNNNDTVRRKLYYPVELDVSGLKLYNCIPVVNISLAQVEQKSYWPVSELTNDQYDAAEAIEFSTQLKLGNVSKKRRVTWSDVVGNKLTLYETAQQNNLTGMTSYENELDLVLKHKEVNVDEGSTTTIRAAQDEALGYSEVTIRARGTDDPQRWTTVVYPVPIMAFGVYTISTLTCVPPSTLARGITFTFADLTAAVVAGGVMGLLPDTFPASANITENGNYEYYPWEYPDIIPNKNCVYSHFVVNVNVQPQLENRFFTISQIYNSNENPFLITKTYDNCYGLGEVRILKDITIPTLIQNQQISVTSNGQYYINPPEGYDGMRQGIVDVNVQPNLRNAYIISNGTYSPSAPYVGYSRVIIDVPNSTETKSITSNGTYTPSSGNIGFSSVEVNVPNSTETKSITSNGTYTPSSGNIGFSSVSVNVPVPSVEIGRTYYIRSNNSVTDIYPDEGYDAMDAVRVSVDVPSIVLTTMNVNVDENGYQIFQSEPNRGWRQITINTNVQPSLDSIQVTENGLYEPSIDYDGYGSVSVEVPQQWRYYEDNNGLKYDLNAMPIYKQYTNSNNYVEKVVIFDFALNMVRSVELPSSDSLTINTGFLVFFKVESANFNIYSNVRLLDNLYRNLKIIYADTATETFSYLLPSYISYNIQTFNNMNLSCYKLAVERYGSSKAIFNSVCSEWRSGLTISSGSSRKKGILCYNSNERCFQYILINKSTVFQLANYQYNINSANVSSDGYSWYVVQMQDFYGLPLYQFDIDNVNNKVYVSSSMTMNVN